MGEHLTEDGRFLSDKYSWSPVDFFAMKMTDPVARRYLWPYATDVRGRDQGLSEDLIIALRNTGDDGPAPGERLIWQFLGSKETGKGGS